MADRSVLLVEGPDDQHVFLSLFKHHRVPKRVEVKPKGGVEQLLRDLPEELRGSDLKHLGVVIDADECLAARWQALRDVLVHSGYQRIPREPEAQGTVVEQEDPPRVGVWLMPDNTLPGKLEDFIRLLLRREDTLWERAVASVASIPAADRRFASKDQIKAEVHTWLAWQQTPGRPLGLAITSRYLDADAPQAQCLMGWVRRLFDVGP